MGIVDWAINVVLIICGLLTLLSMLDAWGLLPR